MHEDCKFIGDTGWCELLFHEPDELKFMCPKCIDYEPKDGEQNETTIISSAM